MGNPEQKEEAYFAARIRNLFELCERTGTPKFSDFLSEEEAARAAGIAGHGGLPFRFWGGYEGAGRAMLGVFPDWMEPETGAFPIVGCTFTYPAAYELTHRDFLGSLMCQQLRRELIGDIVVTPGEAYVFADDRVEKVLLTQMDRIGRVGVSVKKGVPDGISVEQKFKEISGTLASLRLDAAVDVLSIRGKGKFRLETDGSLTRKGRVAVRILQYL